MDDDTAKRAVIVAAGGVTIVRTVHRFAHGEIPKPHDYIAIAAVFVALGFAAEVAPDVAGSIAILALVATVLSDGGEAFDAVNSAVGTPPKKPKGKTP